MHQHHDDGAEAPGLAAPARCVPAGLQPLVAAAGGPAAVGPPPESATPADGPALRGITGQDNEHPNCSDAELAARKRQAEKDDATLVAEFALGGVELVKLADGTWLASRWGMFRPLPTSDDARAWLARVAGR